MEARWHMGYNSQVYHPTCLDLSEAPQGVHSVPEFPEWRPISPAQLGHWRQSGEESYLAELAELLPPVYLAS